MKIKFEKIANFDNKLSIKHNRWRLILILVHVFKIGLYSLPSLLGMDFIISLIERFSLHYNFCKSIKLKEIKLFIFIFY